jgi:hypothetical protein
MIVSTFLRKEISLAFIHTEEKNVYKSGVSRVAQSV